MTDQNNQKGKRKCLELRQRGGVPHAYQKWAVYLIPGYRMYWDSEWERLLLAEKERLQESQQTYEDFERELHENVAWLERDCVSITKANGNKNIIPCKELKSKQKERKDYNGNQEI